MRYHLQRLKLSSPSSNPVESAWPYWSFHKRSGMHQPHKFFHLPGLQDQELTYVRPSIHYPGPYKKQYEELGISYQGEHFHHNHYHKKLWSAALGNEQCRYFQDRKARLYPLYRPLEESLWNEDKVQRNHVPPYGPILAVPFSS